MSRDPLLPSDAPVTALAYLGDAVYEKLIRERLVLSGLASSADLNSAALGYVTAKAQSDAVDAILPLLNDEEEGFYKRGRNSPHLKRAPHGSTLAEYRRASGLETLFGALCLAGSEDRARELIAAAFPDLFSN